MKKVIVIFFILGAFAIIALGLIQVQTPQNSTEDFLRLHIRANSNSAADQDIKYEIKQKVVDALTPVFAGISSKTDAMSKLNCALKQIEDVANTVLKDAGFAYTARAILHKEFFPTRSYNEYCLSEGVYDALIIELGSAQGDNWWCVVYPPLCFLENNIGGDTGVKYKSKLQEIIKRYF